MTRLAFLLPALDFLRELVAAVETRILLSVARSEVPGGWTFMRGRAWLDIDKDVDIEARWSPSCGWRVTVTAYTEDANLISMSTHESLRAALNFAIADAPEVRNRVALYLKENR